ncbi:MAG TPA: phosphatidate cytidylyltransferase [Bacteroidales bacterium]|nr:phosphatidate cytidylyltransferase [Bacteroidales bacterium]
MNNFFKRTLTGSIFVAITTSLILINEWTFLAFVLIANLWLSIEFFRISSHDQTKPLSFTSILTGSIAVILVFLGKTYDINSSIYWLILIPASFIFVEELFLNKQNPLRNISVSFLSLIYITIPLITSILLVYGNNFDFQIKKGGTFHPELLIGILILIWIFDSMAYCVGVPLGKHKLFIRVSPKKSWEGTIGGALFVIVAGIFMFKFFPVISQTDWIVISALVIVFGTIGDLIESLFKRSINVKDSGETLPGHGGLLDRLDSFIFTLPWVLIYFILKSLIS